MTDRKKAKIRVKRFPSGYYILKCTLKNPRLPDSLYTCRDEDGFLRYSISMLMIGYATRFHVDKLSEACKEKGIELVIEG